MEVTPRTDADCRLLFANRVADRVDYLQRKPTTVLDRPAVLVRAPVRHLLGELIDEVSMGGVNLDAVEACTIDRVACCLSERCNVFLDFYLEVVN